MIGLIATDEGLFRLNGTPHREIDGHVGCLSPDGMWALVDGRRLLARRPHGWDEIAVLPRHVPDGYCVASVGDGAWVGTAEAQLVAVTATGVEVLEGFAEAPDRSRWTTPWGGPPDVRTIAGSPDGAEVYVNVHVGGIVASADGGRSWRPVIEMDVDVHQVVPGHDGLVVAACGAEGLARTTDAGASWEHLTEGLHGTYCRAAALAGDSVLVTASDGPFTDDAALYRLEGARFERCERGLPGSFPANLDTGTLAAAGDDALLAAPDGTVYASTDGGRTWEAALEGLPSPTWAAVV